MNKYIGYLQIFLVLLLLQFATSINFSAHAQVIQNLKLKMANDHYSNYHFGEAIPLYEEILHVDPDNIEAKKKLASCYRLSNDSRNSERLYAQINTGENSGGLLDKLYYAQALAENGKYDQSKLWYTKYDGALAIEARAKRFIIAYEKINTFYKDSANWQLEFLSINSPQADFSPSYYKKGLAFCSARMQGDIIKHVYGWDQTPFIDLYYIEDLSKIKGKRYYTDFSKENVLSYYDSSGHIVGGHAEDTKNSGNDSHTLGYYGNTFLKENESWITETQDFIKPFNKKINSNFHEGPLTLSNNGDSMVFTRTNSNGNRLNKGKDGISKLKLYSTSLIEGEWAKPKPLKFNNFKYYIKFTGLNSFNKDKAESDTVYLKDITLDDNQFSVSHPCFSPDYKKFFFVSDAPIGFGGTDIYVCNWKDGKWSDPINCGKNINTEGNEVFPFVDENGRLYFSSDAWGGIGGLDIFYSELDQVAPSASGNNFKRPVNIGFPLNSKKDDFGIIVDKEFTSGYLSSNRKNGVDDDDIFRFQYVGKTTIRIQGIVVHKNTGSPLDSTKIVLRDLKNNLDSIITPVYGMFAFPKLPPGKDYILFIDRKGYHSQKINLNTFELQRGDTSKIKIELVPKEIFLFVNGNVYAEDDKTPMANVKIKIYNNCTGQTDELYTDSEGKYRMRVKENCCYAISAVKENCGVNSTIVSTVGLISDQDIATDFPMLCKGDVVKLDDIYYDIGKWEILPEAASKLEVLLDLMKKYPDMSIELRSHTDSRGVDSKNLLLSDKRAKAAEKYLESKGVNVTKIVGKGYGETLLINRCKSGVECSEEEHKINRRTEFKILSMGKPKPMNSIDATMAGNCKKHVEEIIKQEEDKNKVPDFVPTAVNSDFLEAFVNPEPNPNTLKEEIRPVVPVAEVKKEEPKPVAPAPVVVKKEEVKPIAPPVVEAKKEEVKPVAPIAEVKKEEPKPITPAPVIVKKEEVKPIAPPVVVAKKEEVKPVAPVAEVKKEEPKPVTPAPVVVKKEEVKPIAPPVVEAKKEEVKPVTPVTEVKKEEPKPVTPAPVVVKKEEVKPIAPPVVEVKKEEVKPVAPVTEVKKEEPKPVTPAPVIVKKEEVKPIAPPVVVAKKEEAKPVAPVVEVKKEEPKPVAPAPVVVKKEEVKPVAPVAEVKKEEPKPVTPAPVVVKKEEVKPIAPPVVVAKKEEPKPVAPVTEVKKEEPKPVTPAPVVVKKEEVKPIAPPVVVAKKEEPKPVAPVTEVKKEEPKPVAPAPVVVKKEEVKPTTTAETKKQEEDLFGDLFGSSTPKPASAVKKETGKEVDPYADLFSKPATPEKSSTSAIKGNVYKSGTTEIINGVKLVLKANGRKMDSITTVVNGGFMFNKLPTGTNYEMYVTRKGYYDQKVNVNSSGLLPGQTGNVKVNLVPDPNQKIVEDEVIEISIKGKVVNSKTNIPQAGAIVFITNNIDKTTTELKTNQQGEYTFALKKQCHYTLKSTKGNCQSTPVNKSTIGLTTSETFELDLKLVCE